MRVAIAIVVIGCVTALALAGAPATQGGGPGAEQLELATGRTLTGHLVSLKEGDLIFTTAEGAPPTPLAMLARLVRLPYAPTGRPVDGLVLTSGDVLEGQAVELNAGKLKFDSARFGPVDIDAKLVRAYFFERPMDSLSEAVAASNKAEVLLRSHSRTPSELRWMDAKRVGLSSPLGPVEVNRSEVAWIFLANKGGAAPTGMHRLCLTTGETLVCRLIEIAPDGSVKISWNGGERTLSLDLVRTIESAGEHLEWLSALTPATQSSESLVGPARPARLDRCAGGGPLRLDGAIFDRGIGMRARSQVSWTLNASWQRLRARIGFDQAAVAGQAVTFRVMADGREVFQKPVSRGDAGVELDVPLAGCKQLTLLLDAPAGFEMGDYGDWVDARLLR